ncbi:MAG: hypothetical protein IJK46_01770 [Prevotella sp.]|nr:hypothetical protein [Prevotella sp.]
MKTRILFLVALFFAALPLAAGDYLTIHFKDGHTERHFMHLVGNIGVTKYDLEGNLHSDYQMQQIVMADTTYSYYIADIDHMGFKKVDDEQVQKNVVTVATSIEPIFNQCTTIEDMEQHLDEIKNIEGVENVYSTGTDIVVQVKDWYNIVYNLFLRQEVPFVTQNAKELASRLKKKSNTVNSASTTKPKVAIVFQMVDDLSREWQLYLLVDLKENFERKGFDVTLIADEEKGDEKLDADFYLTRMFDYDMVLLFTHGLSLGGKHALYTGESANAFGGTFLTVENRARQDLDEYGIAGCHVGTERLSDGTYKEKLKYYWYVSEDLIKKSSAKFNGQGMHVVFIGACEQLKGDEKSITFADGQTESYNDSFAQVLFNKGADYVAGYTRKALRSCNAGNNFYRNMLNGFSLDASLAYLPGIQKKEITIVSDEKTKDARLLGLFNPNANVDELRKFFLFETKTAQVSDKELEETYKSGYAVVSGTATAAYPITQGEDCPMASSVLVTPKEKGNEGTQVKLRCGFRHGIDPNLGKDSQEVYSEDPVIEEKTTDNVHFSCNLSLPPECDTYYYQAFTYDGINHNLGNICRINVPKTPSYDPLAISSTSLSISVGESASVDITAGSGEYGVTNLNSSVAKASLQGTIITISAVAEGAAQVVVTDMQTGQHIIINITVTLAGSLVAYTSCPDDHHPHLIDLGLPSGTKWACCNVGAQKPEDYGDFFAWGETSTKSYFAYSNYTHCDGDYTTCHDIGSDIAGTKYDAATANWGSQWIMPSPEQLLELMNSCSREWTTQNGINGRMFTGPNGGKIFLPAAGCNWEELFGVGSFGEYWSSKLGKSYTYSIALSLAFSSEDIGQDERDLADGLSVRPVSKN